MKSKVKNILIFIIILAGIFIAGCGTGRVSVGVGVYVPGAWGPYGGAGYYPPVGIGYPRY